MPPRDADIVLRLWDALRPRLRLNGGLALYEQVERRLLPILLEMERAGVKVDADDLRRMSVDFEARMAVMEQDCHRLAGHAVQCRQPEATGRGAVRRAEAAGRQADEDRGLGDRFLGAAVAGGPGPRAAEPHPGMAATGEAEKHLCRLAGDRHQPRHRARAYVVRDGGRLDRAAVVERSEPAEHSDPDRGRQPDPPRVHRRTRACAGQRGLLADRAAAAGACR